MAILSEYGVDESTAYGLLDQQPVPIPRLSPLKDRSRFVVSPTTFQGVDPVALSKLISLQEQYGSPLYITSGMRNPLLNRQVGGVQKSQHTLGKAVDIALPGASAEDTARLISAASDVGFTGIGGYRPGKVHVDIGPTRVWGPNTSASSIPSLPAVMQGALMSHIGRYPTDITPSPDGGDTPEQVAVQAPKPQGLGERIIDTIRSRSGTSRERSAILEAGSPEDGKNQGWAMLQEAAPQAMGGQPAPESELHRSSQYVPIQLLQQSAQQFPQLLGPTNTGFGILG